MDIKIWCNSLSYTIFYLGLSCVLFHFLEVNVCYVVVG